MTVSRPCYASREDVMRALDYKETARAAGAVDRAIEAASDDVEGLCHRRFYPVLTTRSFDWPDLNRSRSWRLWLNSNEIISATTITSGGQTLTTGDYILRRSDDLDEPPYTSIEINLATDAAWQAGDTEQRAITITGLWGYRADERPAGTLAAGVDATAPLIDLGATDAGVGHLIRVDTERMLITGRTMLDTGQTLAADLAASNAATTVTVADGSAYGLDEVLLLDGERMLIVDIAGNTLIVRRAWDGSTLAAHTTGATIYAARRLTVERGVLGTTAAAHADSAAVARHTPPPLVRDLCVAEALDQLLQESAGYARRNTTNSGNTTSTSSNRSSQNQAGAAIDAIRDRAYTAYGRKARVRAV
jgi:hypothetical protein